MSKRISFVLPGIPGVPVGGIKIAFEYANRLAARGYKVTLYFWLIDDAGRIGQTRVPLFVKRGIKQALCFVHPRWFKLDSSIEKRGIYTIDDASILDGDYIVATAVETSRPISCLSSSKGKKYYLIQGFENWGLSDEEVRATYKLGMTNIVVSNWLKKLVSEESDAYLISNPVDTSVFYNEHTERQKNTVAVLYHESAEKGFRDAWSALTIVKKQIPDLYVQAFGVYKNPGFPSWVHYTKHATQSQLRSIYNSCEAMVCASRFEGFGLTGLEALACGCPLISTDYIGVHEYAVDGENALLSPVQNPELLAENIVRVLNNESLRLSLGHEGEMRAQTLSWDSAVDTFINLLNMSDSNASVNS